MPGSHHRHSHGSVDRPIAAPARDHSPASRDPRPRRSDRGQAALLVVVVAATLFGAIAIGLSSVGDQLIDRRRSQNAADAAALASLDGGRATAAAFAERHGATLVSWQRGPGPHDVTVVVSVGGVTATARATDAP